jgi:ribonuclease HI
MPWVRASLRGQDVYARANPQGALVVHGEQRVEIRYQPDGKAYHASLKNLTISDPTLLADDAFSSPESAPKKRSEPTTAVTNPSNFQPDFVAYADGACSGNPGPAGSGFLIEHRATGVRKEGYEFLGKATNNIAELTAILRALESIADVSARVVLHTDSQYSIGVLQKGWKPKVNQELIERVRREVKRRPNLILNYVRGHAGNPGNERADELARAAVETRGNQPVTVFE